MMIIIIVNFQIVESIKGKKFINLTVKLKESTCPKLIHVLIEEKKSRDFVQNIK